MNNRTDGPFTIEQALGQSKTGGNAAVAFETALSMTGFGKYQWRIVLISGLIFMAAGFQNGLNAYVMSAAQCDLQMSSQEKGLLNAVFLIGGIASAFFWGILADQVGRKNVLVTSLVLDGIATFASSFSQSFPVFAVFRFLNGFIIGAPGSLICTYVGEFIGEKHRAKCVCFIGFFWTISWILLPLIAMGILPLTFQLTAPNFIFNAWRLYVMIFSIPTIVSGVLLACFFSESPKFLYSQGHEGEALDVMMKMHRINFGNRKGAYAVHTILPDSTEGTPARRSIILDPAEIAHVRKAVSSGKSLDVILRGVGRQIFSIFQPPNLGATVLSASLMFCNMFGYYGLGLWLPELFDRFETHYRTSNTSVSVCELNHLGMENSPNTSVVTPHELGTCQHTATDPAVFINTFIIGVSCLVGNIASALFANSIGLRLLTVITMTVSGACALAIYFLNSAWQNLLVSCLFLSFVGAANNIINSAICDLFPTRIRALAVCSAIFAGRTGAVLSNLILGYVLDSYCEVPVFLMAGALIIGGFLGLLLPGYNTIKITSKT